MDNICNAIPVRCPDSSAPFLFLLDSLRCSVEPRILRQLAHNGILFRFIATLIFADQHWTIKE